ncbi:MAG: class I SAM-dependent methyltransferase [Actinobacteria bacterium]|nr:class I SAM-dependent methyltransferase [Actinomycetota bacterium]
MNGLAPNYDEVPRATWTLRMPRSEPERTAEIRDRITQATAASQYGWGHSIDFGPFRQEGFLGTLWLAVAAALDQAEMWPQDLSGMRVADVGAFTGGLSALMASRGADLVYSVDELPGHAQQARVVSEAFELERMRVVESSLYDLHEVIEPDSLDLILLSGVLYHLSDMLVGLYTLRRLLKPGGVLVVETNAVHDLDHSYANFGRYYAGMWWQPTSLCVSDMYQFMGFEAVRVEPFVESRCIAAGVKSDGDIPFKRGLHWSFENREDARERQLDWRVMAPAPLELEQPDQALTRVQRLAKKVFRIS